MASLGLPNEYSSIVRLENDVKTPPGHTFISSSLSPTVQQLSRDLTLARGRILYEVWDSWNHTIDGYLVPSSIASIAMQCKDGVRTEAWEGLPSHQQNAIRQIHTTILRHFPRIPAASAIRVAEKAQREKSSVRKSTIEERVVQHARHEWTSYDLKLESSHRLNQPPSAWSGIETIQVRRRLYQEHYTAKKAETPASAKPRMREVLRSWLPEDISSTELALFWRKHDLFDAEEGIGGSREQDVLFKGASLQDYGRLETVCNFVRKVEAFL